MTSYLLLRYPPAPFNTTAPYRSVGMSAVLRESSPEETPRVAESLPRR